MTLELALVARFLKPGTSGAIPTHFEACNDCAAQGDEDYPTPD
jgi:hypothetical protein